jgi:hypothetical protein
LADACLADVGDRIYPLFNIIGLNDNTPAPETKTSGYGEGIAYVEKPHSFELDTRDYGSKFFAELRKFRNRKDLRVYWIDASGFIGGQKNSSGDLLGFRCTFKPKQIKVGNVADVSKYMVQLDLLDPTCLTDKIDAIKFDDDVNLSNELNGVLNVEVTGFANNVGAGMRLSTEISKINLYEEYSDELAAVGAWSLRVNGVAHTITGVTKVPITKEWQLTWASITGNFEISLAPTLTLAGLGVGGNGASGFESPIPYKQTVV